MNQVLNRRPEPPSPDQTTAAYLVRLAGLASILVFGVAALWATWGQ